ncbi:UDP-glycosyltransferase 91B1-like [Phragmites australis]|uniref:UDP-glycosyltransferase 91B1-like n=1 Tax=Phragmites australis TaxID=29695 RepID=UPI002D79E3F4|nr:UDP-glycosyltransferase 91B1-like [Phragmites australis]
MDTRSSSPLHVVICPWLAFGHMLPCLDLAERLAARGHRVSYVSTPRNIARLQPVRPDAAPRVDLVALPLPRVDGLPDGAESTNDVSYEKFELLWEAFDGLAAPFAEFLGATCTDEGKRPDWVIADIFHHWVVATALEHKVPCAVLLLSAANNIVTWPRRSSWRTGPAAAAVQERPAVVPRFESERKARLFTNHGASGMSVAQRCTLTLERCTLVVMRSCLEWEPESVPLVPTLHGIPIVPIGLLPPSPDGGRGASINGEDATVRWLDAQPANSVVYIALGSEVPLSVEQVRELAIGLELAGTRFLWALRKPGSVLDADILPPGFQERTHGHGLVTMGWVPQLSILAHGAVGAFLTHCGWSSIIEGLLFGHPLIMLPIHVDQGPNARLMEGKKVGVQVPRDENDGSIDREGVASTVRAVMLEEETRSVLAANAKRSQEIVADKELHESYIDGFIKQLRSYKG